MRNYLSIAKLQEYADITVTDEAEAFEQIEMAEEIIDIYVGFQKKHVTGNYRGQVTSVDGANVFDTDPSTPLTLTDNYFANCILEIVGGTGAGQRKRIASSSMNNKSLTLESAFSTSPDSTSIYKIFQLAKFPRGQDAIINRAGDAYYKSIPEAVSRAVAAQVEYMIEMGDEFFKGADSDMNSERIGNYSYSNGGGASAGQSSVVKMTAPKARMLLRGIMNRLGRIEV